MGILTRLKKKLLGPAETADYRGYHPHYWTRIRDLPWYHHQTAAEMLLDPTVRLGLAMRAAPLCTAEFAYKVDRPGGDSTWVPGVQADDPAVAKWVYRQLLRIWRNDIHKLLRAQIWGWAAGEVVWSLREGMVDVDTILFRSAVDTYALVQVGAVSGVRFKGLKKQGQVDLLFPQAVWHAYDPEYDQPYGRSALRGAHSPWHDKWSNGGALDTRRLFAHKDAYGGVDLGFPAGTTRYNGRAVPNENIARQIAEQLLAGGITTRPSERDENGNEKWPLTRATVPASPTHIFDYPKDLDTEILRGMEIPDDVIKSDVGGAWQGKQVPMYAFYTNGDIWLGQVVKSVVTQIIEPGVILNFGEGHRIEVTTKPLAEQALERMNAAQGPEQDVPDENTQSGQFIDVKGKGGQKFKRRNPNFGKQRMGLIDDATAAELLIGSGVVDAGKLLEAGQRFMSGGHNPRRNGNRWSTDNGHDVDDVAAVCGLTTHETKILHLALAQ
jgi:hypothetical protein